MSSRKKRSSQKDVLAKGDETMKGQALNFDEISTKDLVRELTKREGISQIWVEPENKKLDVQITSPTLILVVTD